MKRFSLLYLVIVALAAQAATISEQDAQQRAATFFGVAHVTNASRPSLALKAKMSEANVSASPAYYVFNNNGGNGGWVVIAGDDRVRTVLAYCDHGQFNPSDMNESAQWLLDYYTDVINSLDNCGIEMASNNATAKQAIKPLMTSMWGQGAPYNFQCPIVDGKQCYVGCTATAIAQVMYYHKWPESTPEIPEYTPYDKETKGLLQPALPSTTFNWDVMKDYYRKDVTDTADPANEAVAKLMHYVGQAQAMNYGTSASGAFANPAALVQYFGYSRNATIVGRTENTADSWVNIIYNELAAKRPVILSGYKWSGGHTFVCDGYDGDGLFHINWGWNGSSDGYYSIDVLNSSGGGIGSVNGPDGYTISLRAMINVKPADESEIVENGSNLYTRGVPKVNNKIGDIVTRTDASNAFSPLLNIGFYNMCHIANTYDVGWGVYDSNNQLISTTVCESGKVFTKWNYKFYDKNVDFGVNVTDGVYFLRPICRASDNGTWRMLIDSGLNYVRAEINGSECTLFAYGSSIQGPVSIDQLSFSGIKRVGHSIDVNLDLTNHTDCEFIPIYLTVDGEKATANSIVAPALGTASGVLHFVPTSAGTKEIKLYSDNLMANEIYATSITIDESPEASLSFNTTIAGVNNKILNSSTAEISINITNQLNQEFDDIIIVNLTKQLPDNLYYRISSQMLPCKIAANGSAVINATFNKLENGESYMIVPYYISVGERKKGRTSSTFRIQLPEFDKYDINQDGDVNVGDISAIYAAILGSQPAYATRADVNGDGVVNTGDVSALYAAIMAKQ